MEPRPTFERESILARLKSAGTFDPDVLAGLRADLRRRAREARHRGNAFVLLGLASLLTVVGAPFGGLLICAGVRLRDVGARRLRSVEHAFAAYTLTHSYSNRDPDPTTGGRSPCSES